MVSRDTPASRAAFHPTVMDMSAVGASSVGGWLGESHRSVHSSVPGMRRVHTGASEADWTPPATTADSMPERTDAAAMLVTARPEAQCRLTAVPAADTRPAAMAA